jgi:hypothetical protein
MVRPGDRQIGNGHPLGFGLAAVAAKVGDTVSAKG